MSKSIQLKDKNNEKFYPHPYYPVGSIYLSVNNTNPSKWFGGTWVQIAKGRTLVGVDTNDADFNTVQKTGGSKKLQAHSHRLMQQDGQTLFQGGVSTYYSGATGWGITGDSSMRSGGILLGNITSTTGSGNSENLQPYFTCYIWCRTA